MSQISYTNIGAGITLPVVLDPGGQWTVLSLYIANGTNAPITISDLSGNPYATIVAYTSTTIPINNASGIKLSGTQSLIQPTDVLNAIALDYNILIQTSRFGPASWGAGPDVGTLTQINVGDQILAWQLRQFYLALATGAVKIGNIVSGGAQAGYDFNTRDGLTPFDWAWYATGQSARLWNQVNHDVFTVGPTGSVTIGDALNVTGPDLSTFLAAVIILGGLTVSGGETVSGTLTANGRISAAATGVSAKALLNAVPLTTIAVVLSGTGDQAATLFTLTGLPASATTVWGEVSFNCATVNALGQIVGQGSGIIGQATVAVASQTGIGPLAGGVFAVGATNQLKSQVTGTSGAAWTLTVSCSIYAEVS